MGLWHKNGSPNLGQSTRPYNNQQKKKRACRIVDFVDGWPLSKTERQWKKEVPRPC